LLHRDIPVYMSIISLGELYLGAFKSDNAPKNLSLVNYNSKNGIWTNRKANLVKLVLIFCGRELEYMGEVK
jgi:predicted nucleic acid-binding protein